MSHLLQISWNINSSISITLLQPHSRAPTGAAGEVVPSKSACKAGWIWEILKSIKLEYTWPCIWIDYFSFQSLGLREFLGQMDLKPAWPWTPHRNTCSGKYPRLRRLRVLFHVTDAPGSPRAIPTRVLWTTVFVGLRIWGNCVWHLVEALDRGSAGPACATRGRHIRSPAVTRRGLALLTPRPQWRTPGIHAKAANRSRRPAARNRLVGLCEGNQGRTSAAVRCGAGFPGCDVYLREGLPQLPEVRARQFGSPGRAGTEIDRFSTLPWVGPGSCLGTHDLSATRACSRRRRVLLLWKVTPSSPLSD